MSLDSHSGTLDRGKPVEESDIADDAVTDAKIAPHVSTKITGLPTWTVDIDAGGNNVLNVGFFEDNSATPAATGVVRIGNNLIGLSWKNNAGTDEIEISVNTADEMVFTLNATIAMVLSETKLNLNTIDLDNVGSVFIGTPTTTVGRINFPNALTIAWDNVAKDNALEISANASDEFDFEIDGVTEYTYSATLADFKGNDLIGIQNIQHDLSTATSALDFANDELQSISITVNTTFTGTGYATGKSKVLRIITDSTLRTLDFPTGWIFVGTKPADQAASKTGILSLTCFGTLEADVVASYAVEE